MIGAKKDAHRLPPLDLAVVDDDSVVFGAKIVRVIETPGHTLGHVVYHLVDDSVVVAGDTLFSLGCGRVMEGDMPMMYASLQRIAALPAATKIYCGHEYTLANGRFAATVNPGNAKLRDRISQAERLRAEGAFTIPTTVGMELETNPFLRAEDADIRRTLSMENAEPVAVFAELRERKNRF